MEHTLRSQQISIDVLTRRVCDAEALAEQGANYEAELRRERQAREEGERREALLGACVDSQRAELEEARYELSIAYETQQAVKAQQRLHALEKLESDMEQREQQVSERRRQLEEAATLEAKLQARSAALIWKLAPTVDLLLLAATRFRILM